MLIIRFLCWKNMSCVSTKHIGRFMVSQTPILNLPHNGVREMGLSVPSLVSPPRFVLASKWGRRINKQCTSDYWAEDQSEPGDRSLLPSLSSSPSPLHPHILPVSSPCLLHPSLTLIAHSFPPSAVPSYLSCLLSFPYPCFYRGHGASKYLECWKCWESIDLRRGEVERGHLAAFKRHHRMSAKGLDTVFWSFCTICPCNSLFNEMFLKDT